MRALGTTRQRPTLTVARAVLCVEVKKLAPVVPNVAVALPCNAASPPQPARLHCSSDRVVAVGWARFPGPTCRRELLGEDVRFQTKRRIP